MTSEKEMLGHRDRNRRRWPSTSQEKGSQIALSLAALRRSQLPTPPVWAPSKLSHPPLAQDTGEWQAISIHSLHNWSSMENNSKIFILLFSREKMFPKYPVQILNDGRHRKHHVTALITGIYQRHWMHKSLVFSKWQQWLPGVLFW